METFRVNERMQITCESKKTRNGFAHIAVLLIDGREFERAKCNYLNRTWERYEFESVLKKLVDILDTKRSLPLADRRLMSLKIDGQFAEDDSKRVSARFGMIAGVMALGDVFGKNKAESNDWKRRMLKAGIGEALIEPEDWGTLSEEQKEERMNGVIKMFREN